MRRELFKLLPIAAVLLTASCTDKQYDLSNIDTTSRLTAKGLIVPLNLEPIQLDAIISIKDNSDIRKDANGYYYFQKKCSTAFCSKDVFVDKITIAKPKDISEKIAVNIALPDIINKIEQYAKDKSIGEILSDPTLCNKIGINANSPIYNVNINDSVNINLTANNIDSRITKLGKLGFDPLTLSVNVKLDKIINTISFKELTIGLPCGFTITNISNNGEYNTTTGELYYKELNLANGQTNIQGTVTELTYATMEAKGAKFDADKHTFEYKNNYKITGKAEIKANQLNPNAKVQDIKEVTKFTYYCDVKFSNNLVVNKFNGGINYEIENIDIDPVNINNLPEMLQETGTNIELSNPQLYLDVTNPFFKNNITITAGLRIVGNVAVPQSETGKKLTFDVEENKIVLSPKNEDLLADKKGYNHEVFEEMKNILSGDSSDPEKNRVPGRLDIKIINPLLDTNNVKDFELGVNHPGITGKWDFYTKLSLTEKTKIVYTKEWDNWGSKDLGNLTIENATLQFHVKKHIAMNADNIEFTLLGKTGNLYGKTTLQGDEEQEITITLTGGPVKDIYGGRVKVNLKGLGLELNKNQAIEISNLRVAVDGYYDTDL